MFVVCIVVFEIRCRYVDTYTCMWARRVPGRGEPLGRLREAEGMREEDAPEELLEQRVDDAEVDGEEHQGDGVRRQSHRTHSLAAVRHPLLPLDHVPRYRSICVCVWDLLST